MISRRALIVSGLSVAALGGVGYGFWPRLDGYREELQQQRRLLSSDPTLQDLVRMATLAANGHNTQPWKFRLGEGGVKILPDLTRRTTVVDPDDHHLYVSLGCAAENLIVSARAHGRLADVTIEEGDEPQIDIALVSKFVGFKIGEIESALLFNQATPVEFSNIVKQFGVATCTFEQIPEHFSTRSSDHSAH